MERNSHVKHRTVHGQVKAAETMSSEKLVLVLAFSKLAQETQICIIGKRGKNSFMEVTFFWCSLEHWKSKYFAFHQHVWARSLNCSLQTRRKFRKIKIYLKTGKFVPLRAQGIHVHRFSSLQVLWSLNCHVLNIYIEKILHLIVTEIKIIMKWKLLKY